eukprot:scaffold526_cov494-Pavlova_lutheri.AAC.2
MGCAESCTANGMDGSPHQIPSNAPSIWLICLSHLDQQSTWKIHGQTCTVSWTSPNPMPTVDLRMLNVAPVENSEERHQNSH